MYICFRGLRVTIDMSAGDERLELAIGPINGINRNFSTPTPYEAGSLYTLPDGQLWEQDDDEGPEELTPSLGTFRMRTAPRNGAQATKLWTRYIEA
jgi:hypothetical protein